MEKIENLREPVWEQQEGESTRAYMMFLLFRDYGPNRSVPAIFNKYNGIEFNYSTHSGLQEYSGPMRWYERAKAFDSYILNQEQKENEALIKKFNKERMSEALELLAASFSQMKEDAAEGSLQPRENRERYKMAFEMFRTINNLDKEHKIEHSGEIKIIFGDELEEV
jgi:hypothetical protein